VGASLSQMENSRRTERSRELAGGGTSTDIAWESMVISREPLLAGLLESSKLLNDSPSSWSSERGGERYG
jgi:hypothetical protein